MGFLTELHHSRAERGRKSGEYRTAVIVDEHHIDDIKLVPASKDEFSHDDGIYVMDPGGGAPYADGALFKKGVPNPIKIDDVSEDGDVFGDVKLLDDVVNTQLPRHIMADAPDPEPSSWLSELSDEQIRYLSIAVVGMVILGLIIAIVYMVA